MGKINLPLVLTVAPIVAIGLLIILGAVNVPILDQWELVPMFEHLRNGHFVWTDFWWQHNEHRVLIPSLILAGLGTLTHWNIIAECLLSFAVSIASFLGILKIIKMTGVALKRPVFVFLPALVSLIWFSTVQVENWLWGWQLEWFLNVSGVVMAAYVLARIKGGEISNRSLLLLIGAILLAQYSLGNGTLLWPLVVAILLLKGVSYVKTAGILGVGAISTFFYYWHYVVPVYPPKTLFLKDPVGFTHYVFAYLGKPITFQHLGMAILGGLLVLGFIALNIYLFVKLRKTFAKLLPVLLLGWYAIGSACITGVSRMGFGISQAYSSRYTTIAMLLLIATIITLSFVHKDLRQFLPKNMPNFVPKLAVAGLVLLLLANYAWGIRSARTRHREFTVIQQCTHAAQPTDNCLLQTYPWPSVARERLEYLKRVHWGGY